MGGRWQAKFAGVAAHDEHPAAGHAGDGAIVDDLREERLVGLALEFGCIHTLLPYHMGQASRGLSVK